MAVEEGEVTAPFEVILGQASKGKKICKFISANFVGLLFLSGLIIGVFFLVELYFTSDNPRNSNFKGQNYRYTYLVKIA